MKHLFPATIAAACVLAACNASAEFLHYAEVKDIDFQFVDTPRFRLHDAPDRAQERSPNQWLEIEAEVDVKTVHKSRFIPELTATWHVVVMEPGYERQHKGDAQGVRLTGEITYLDIRTHDGTVNLVAYVHPNTLARITGQEHPTKQDIVTAAVTLSGPKLSTTGKNAKLLEKATSEPKPRWWANWEKKTYKDLVVPKYQTPFAPLWTDVHPAAKRK